MSLLLYREDAISKLLLFGNFEVTKLPKLGVPQNCQKWLLNYLLEVLDGLASSPGRIFSNGAEHSALIEKKRPGDEAMDGLVIASLFLHQLKVDGVQSVLLCLLVITFTLQLWRGCGLVNEATPTLGRVTSSPSLCPVSEISDSMALKPGLQYNTMRAMWGVKCACVCRNRLGFYSCVSCIHKLRCIVSPASVCVCGCTCGCMCMWVWVFVCGGGCLCVGVVQYLD